MFGLSMFQFQQEPSDRPFVLSFRYGISINPLALISVRQYCSESYQSIYIHTLRFVLHGITSRALDFGRGLNAVVFC